MKKILIFLITIVVLSEVKGQVVIPPGYQGRNSRENILATASNATTIAAGDSAQLKIGQWKRAGAVYVDTTGVSKGFYYYRDGVFIKVVDTTMTSFFEGSDQLAVESITALIAATDHSDNKIAVVAGHTTKGDGGGGNYVFVAASTATHNDGTIIEPADSEGAPGRWIKVEENGGVVYARTFGIKNDLTNQKAAIEALYSISTVTHVKFDQGGKIAVDGRLNIPIGKSYELTNNTMFTSAGGANDTLSYGYLICDVNKQAFDTTLTVMYLENVEKSGVWFGAKADMIASNPTPTSNVTPLLKAIKASNPYGSVSGKIYFPARVDSTGYAYWFHTGVTITQRVEIYGDSYSPGSLTTFVFPGNGFGLKFTGVTISQRLHDLRIRGSLTATKSTGFNSETAHGVIIGSNNFAMERVYIIAFDGDGLRVDGSGFNANYFKVKECIFEGNGRAGSYTTGNDGNAGAFVDCKWVFNARYGPWAHSFLGEKYDGGSISSNVINHSLQKSAIKYRAAVSVGGNRYRAIAASTNQTPPNATYWADVGAGGVNATFQAWSSSRIYDAPALYFALQDHLAKEPTQAADWETYWGYNVSAAPPFWLDWFADTSYLHGGGARSDNANARNTFISIYIEGDQPNFYNSSPSLAIGGELSAGGSIAGAIGRSQEGIQMQQLTLFNYAGKHGSLRANKEDVLDDTLFSFRDGRTNGGIFGRGAGSSGFGPVLDFIPEGITNFNNTYLIVRGTNVGSTPLLYVRATNMAGNGVVTVPLFGVYNHTTKAFEIAATGQLTNPFLTATGTRLMTTTSVGAINAITNGTNGQVMKLVSGAPVWADETTAGNDSAYVKITMSADSTWLYFHRDKDNGALVYIDSVKFNPGSGTAAGEWGDITGTLSDQTDLQAALDAKQASDADLTTIAGLTATTDNFMQAKAGAWASRTIAQVKTDLGLTGTNSGDQTITLTGGVTGSGIGSFAATVVTNANLTGPVTSTGNATAITADAVTLAMMADVATATVFYRKTAATGNPEVQTLATLKTDLGLTGTNSGDQTSIVGLTGTLAQFNTAVTDADLAPIASPTFTGAPLAPTAASGTNTTQLATTAYVMAAAQDAIDDNPIYFDAGDFAGAGTVGDPITIIGGGGGETNTASNLGGGLANYSTKVGVDLQFNSFAAADFDLASNLITIDATKWLTSAAAASAYQPLDADLTTVAGLTATTDNFIQSKSGAWASRTIAQVKTDLGLTGTNSGDQTSIVGITGTLAQFNTAVTDADIAPIASPTFTGVPAGPTAAAGTNTTQLATTAFVETAKGTDPTTASFFVDDFHNNSTESGEIGVGWSFVNGSLFANNTIQNHPGSITRRSGTSIGQVASMWLNGSLPNVTQFRFDEFDEATFIVQLFQTNADFDIRVGLSVDAGVAAPAHSVYFERLAAETSWFGVSRNASTETRTAALVAQSTNWVKLKLRRISSSSVGFSVDGGTEVTLGTNIPDAADGLTSFHHIIPTTTTARDYLIEFFSMKLLPIAR